MNVKDRFQATSALYCVHHHLYEKQQYYVMLRAG